MKTRWRLILGFGGLVVLAAIALFILKKSSQSELEKFKAELRARGEKLTYEELLGTVDEDTNTTRFVLAAGPLASGKIQPGEFAMMYLVAPGRAMVGCQQQLVPHYTGVMTSNTWQDFASELNRFDGELEELREILKTPAPHFANDYTNFWTPKKRPYVARRTAAQWFAGSTLSELQRGNLGAALADMESLANLTRLHGESLNLVDQMIRSAIAGLGLHVTWEALQVDGWNDAQLERLQGLWQNIDFLEMLELGFTGERALNIALFDAAKASKGNFRSLYGGTRPGTGVTAGQVVEDAGGRLWTAVAADRDHLYSLRWFSTSIDATRRLRTNEPWFNFSTNAVEQQLAIEKLAASPQRFLHLLSLIAIPNFNKASETIVRNEVFRRLTITAIAIKRYQLRHGTVPPTLDALAPEFLTAVPIDCMDGKPLKYRSEGRTFTLYSVGQDGVDNKGDARPIRGIKPDLHAAHDVVWPHPATEAEIAAAPVTTNRPVKLKPKR